MRGTLSLFFAAVVATTCSVSLAHADGDAYAVHSTIDDAPKSTSRVETHWYGWQNMIVDGASIGVFVFGLTRESAPIAWSGVMGMGLGSAAVHFTHDNVGRGFASVGLRVALPALGYFIGNAASCGGGHEDYEGGCEWMPQVIGLGVGALVAMAIDDGALAHEDVKKTPENTVIPTMGAAPSPDGKSRTLTFGVVGTF